MGIRVQACVQACQAFHLIIQNWYHQLTTCQIQGVGLPLIRRQHVSSRQYLRTLNIPRMKTASQGVLRTSHEKFRSGAFDTNFVRDHFRPELLDRSEELAEAGISQGVIAELAAGLIERAGNTGTLLNEPNRSNDQESESGVRPWRAGRRFA